jgi:hypothetical protein
MTTTSMLTYPAAATITFALPSLANGAWRASTAVDNTANLYMDATIGGSIQVDSTAPTAGGTIDFYLYASYDGTNYTGGVTGTDATYSDVNNETSFHFMHSIVVTATIDINYEWGPFNVLSVLGHMPPKWGIVVENNTGRLFHATGTANITKYTGIKYASA